MSKPIEIGDHVAYSAKFLRDTGQVASADDRGGWRGTVIEILGSPDWRLCRVRWHHSLKHHSNVLDENLARVGSPEMSTN